MVLHALEMEDEDEEETESLMYEVNQHQTNGTAQASARTTNGVVTQHSIKNRPAASATSKKATYLFGLTAIAAVLILYAMSGGTNTVDHGDTSMNQKTPDHDHDPAAAPPASAKDTTPYVPPPKDEGQDETTQKDFVYSNLATIRPDPDQIPATDPATKQSLADAWGQWHFWDGDEAQRPKGDYCANYKNRDIPGDAFPDTAWQTDAVFVNHVLNDAEQLVARSMEAIYTEYGHGKEGMAPEQLAERAQMFHWYRIDISSQDTDENKPIVMPEPFTKKGDKGAGGWTTERSLDGLVQRLLHALMTNDQFTIVLAGHSAAAGHGNHFHQSYLHQCHKIVAPVLARLGVQLVTRNLSQGGLGTLHNGLGANSLYGDDIDLLLWDAGMTEPDAKHADVLMRQVLLSENKIPVVWGGPFKMLQALHNELDADVGNWGTGMAGIPLTTSNEQAETLPYAARYLKCDREHSAVCQEEPVFCTHCWIDRPDIPHPEQLFDQIDQQPHGQVKWHPGWRHHQLQGRVLAFAILDALQVAIEIWSDGTMGGPLDDEWWHVTDYYENIRQKVKKADSGICFQNEGDLPVRICHTPLQARSLFTPRANPAQTSLSTIFKPAPNGYVPHNENTLVYEGPDVHNPCYDLPADAVDVLSIVSGRRRLSDAGEWIPVEGAEEEELPYSKSMFPTTPRRVNATRPSPSSARYLKDEIVMGQGWQVIDEKAGECDGSYYAICGREKSNPCPMIGHHDSRGSVVGNEWAGWLVMELPDLKEGIIILKVVTYLDEKVNTRTAGWTVNNERRLEVEDDGVNVDDEKAKSEEKPEQGRRRTGLSEWPEGTIFDFAIDGKITSLNKEQFTEKRKKVQRVMEVLTLLDDPNFTSSPKTVEVAIRMRNCGRQCTLALTHVYWA